MVDHVVQEVPILPQATPVPDPVRSIVPEAPMTTDPEVVGSAIVQALRKGKSVIYVPGPLRFLMTAVKAVPRPLFRRLPQ